LATTTVTLSVILSNTLLTTVNWAAAYATTIDNFGATTAITSGSWTVNSTPTRYTATIAIPSGAVTGLQITLSVGAQISGTWTIANVQLEPGAIVTPFEREHIETTLFNCQKYYYNSVYNTANTQSVQLVGYAGGSGSIPIGTVYHPVAMRTTPTLSFSGVTYTNGSALTASSSIATPTSNALTLTAGAAGAVAVAFAYTATAEL
jgi:hypothetical protein